MIAVIAIIAALVADALALYVAAELLAAGYADEHPHAVVNAATLVVLVLAAYGIPRAIERFDVSPARGYLLVGVASVVGLYGAMRIEFAGDVAIWDFSWFAGLVRGDEAVTVGAGAVGVGVVLMVLAWLRGAWRASDELELEMVPRQLGIPFAIVIVVCLLAAWTDRMDAVGQAAIAFFAVAVLALAFSQSALSGATIGSLRSGSVTGALLGLTALATIASVVAFGIVFGFLGQQIGGLVEDVVYFVLLVVLTPLVWVIDLVFGWLFSGLSAQEMINPPAAFGEAGDLDEESGRSRVFAGIWRVLLLLVAVAIIAGLIALVTRLYRRTRQRPVAGPVAASAGGLGEDLRTLLRNPFSRRTSAQSAGQGAAALYRQLLEDGRRSGRPRESSETPGEYAPALTSLFHTEVTDEITAAFIEARYAGREPDPAVVRELERRWRETHQ